MPYCECSDVCGGQSSTRHRVHPKDVRIGMPATFYLNGDAYPGSVVDITFEQRLASNGNRFGRKVFYVHAKFIGISDIRKFKLLRDSVYGERLVSFGGHGELVVGHSYLAKKP